MNLKPRQTALVLLFLAAIFLPAVAMIAGWDHTAHLRENRTPTPFPRLSLSREDLGHFPHDFFCYFRDNFGYRDALIRLNFRVRRTILRESVLNDVVFGRQGWLFYQGEHEMDDARGITRYSAETLRRWGDSLEAKRAWLAARGIRYLFVVVPCKETVYPEYLPDYLGRVGRETGLDQLVSYLGKHTAVEVLDLRGALLRAKGEGRVFEKTDTHWNGYGAFVGYREIMGRVAPWFPVLHTPVLADYQAQRSVEQGGDLAAMAGAEDALREEELTLVPRRGAPDVRLERDPAGGRNFTLRRDAPGLPRLLVFRDSFFDALFPFFGEQFQYARFQRQHWDQAVPIQELLRDCRPDLVIEEFAERRIKMDMGDFAPPAGEVSGRR